MNVNFQENLHDRSYLISSDDMDFLYAWSNGTLEFEKWNHKAHIRIAYIIIVMYYPNFSMMKEKIKSGIKFYNSKHQDKLKVGYHETITMFWINQVYRAIGRHLEEEQGFEDFLLKESQLLKTGLIYDFYSKNYLFSEEAKNKYLNPDVKNDNEL